MQIEQQLAEIQSKVADTLKLALKKGATQAEASMSKVEGISVSSRLREVENIEFTNDGGLGISVYVGKHKGSASTADLSMEALALAVEKAVDIAKYTSEDPCTGLADAELIATEFPDLDLYHPVPLDPQKAIKTAVAAESAALDYDPRITNSDGASYNANMGMRVYGNTHGINAGYTSSRYSLSCMVIASDNDDMQRDYAYTVSRDASKLDSAEAVGLEAAQCTVARLGAQKIKTATVPVLIDKQLASSLFGHYVGAISGGSLYRRSSFLLDKLGSQVFPEWLNIVERPHLKGGLASSNFDHEGVATKDMTIVDSGKLSTYLYTSYSARKLNTVTNGHAGGIHNWIVSDSGQSDAELLKTMGTGLYVTEMMGQGVNIVTGDYSRGAAGFWVENGVIQYPVHEVTIAGTLQEMFANIVAIGAERDARGSVSTGAVLLEKMKIAGA
ncbi:metalloprotease PmbA [Alteromonas alba]|jgi:PmbA protein|uniref:Metalloprotease PmbA n=1 Tax=Alteromonas alba TaxID=2079529 RepID=A0A2S9VDI2_9ALTE|nr:metalloprotease PmbA [Alteromonas alba]PRO74541.1 metalloprotease PmbA [Alteromonas alba]HCA75971.1 metalloprotease PmbA [Alteromonas sp.]HCB08256.1 metalloprotease PmbA [Alteromonas sp.]HCV19420.1 metalloprotease PmbA [Alteromonas sp.]|tara:strand:- start:5631 stop:6962 length:1332 start_codon:yes stop_codon:yes gene_type:complete